MIGYSRHILALSQQMVSTLVWLDIVGTYWHRQNRCCGLLAKCQNKWCRSLWVFCGMQLLIPAWDTCFWCPSPHLSLLWSLLLAELKHCFVMYIGLFPSIWSERSMFLLMFWKIIILCYIVICWACCSDTYHSDKVSAHCYTQHPIIKPRSTKLKGALLVSPCPSDHLFIYGQNRICSVSSIMIIGSIIKQLQKVCCL